MLTLLIVPAGFSLADGAEQWIGPKLGRVGRRRRAKDIHIARPSGAGNRLTVRHCEQSEPSSSSAAGLAIVTLDMTARIRRKGLTNRLPVIVTAMTAGFHPSKGDGP
jgi:hypothetical protein